MWGVLPIIGGSFGEIASFGTWTDMDHLVWAGIVVIVRAENAAS